MIIDISDFVQGATKACDVVVKGWIGAIRRNNCVTFAYKQADQIAKQPVDAFAHHDMIRCASVMLGQCLT